VVMYINGINSGINLDYVGEAGCKANTETIRIGTQTPDFYLPLNGAVYDVRMMKCCHRKPFSSLPKTIFPQ